MQVYKNLRLVYFILLSFLSGHSASAEPALINFVSTIENDKFHLLIKAFTEKTGVPVQFIQLDNNELKSQLQLVDEKQAIPDVLLVPADFIGLNSLDYSKIPADWLNPNIRKPDLLNATLNKQVLGIPIISGNHLVLYYDKSRVSQPITDWKELKLLHQQHPNRAQIGWSFYEMYWFIPFLTAFDALPYIPNTGDNNVHFATPKMREALTFYWQQNQSGIINGDCSYKCAFDDFMAGNLAYFIDGFWSYDKLKSQFGEQLGISQLPNIDGKPMRSYFSAYVLLYPNQSLTSNKQKSLKIMAEYMQSYQVQQKLWQEYGAIPTHQKAFAELTQSSDMNVRSVIQQIETAEPMPNGPEMAIVWEVLFKGFNRYGSGVMDAERAGDYMQYIAQRSIKNVKNHPSR